MRARNRLRASRQWGSIADSKFERTDTTMATHGTPHFSNDLGVERIHIGVKEFQCIGAHPPMDHPHIYLDMGADDQIICPYCSTLYTYDPNLGPDQSDPPYCLYREER